jgi:hypothetical protein
VILTSGQTFVDSRKAPVAGAIMAGVVLTVLIGWLPIHLAALMGATLMVVSGCLTREEAHRAVARTLHLLQPRGS